MNQTVNVNDLKGPQLYVPTLGVLFFGVMLTLCGLEVPNSNVHGWLGRSLCILFGSGLLLLAWGLFKKGLLPTLDRYTAPQRNFVSRLFLYLSLKPSWKTLLASIAYFILALEYYLIWQHEYAIFGEYQISRNALIDLAGIEFLVIHSTPFLGILSLGGGPLKKKCIYIAFGILASLYLIGGYMVAGWFGIVATLSLAVMKHLRLFLRPAADEEKSYLGLRWGLQMVLFVNITAIFVSDIGDSGSIPFGVFYFLALGLVELFGIFSGIEPDTKSHPLPPGQDDLQSEFIIATWEKIAKRRIAATLIFCFSLVILSTSYLLLR